MYLEYRDVFQSNFIPNDIYQYWNMVNIFLISFMFISQNQISVFSF